MASSFYNFLLDGGISYFSECAVWKPSGSTKNIFNTKCRCIYKTFLIVDNELDFTKRCICLFSRRKVEYFISITDIMITVLPKNMIIWKIFNDDDRQATNYSFLFIWKRPLEPFIKISWNSVMCCSFVLRSKLIVVHNGIVLEFIQGKSCVTVHAVKCQIQKIFELIR